MHHLSRRQLVHSVGVAGLALLAGCGRWPWQAQERDRVYRMGYLRPIPLDAAPHLLEAFRHGLREHGYVEGSNLIIEYRSSDGNSERLPDLAAELVSLQVDVIVAAANPAIQAAKNATSTIPIVMAPSGDPVGAGLVASLSRPGGNITGVSLLTVQLSAKRLELLKEILPGLSRVAYLSDPRNPSTALDLREMHVAAQTLGLTLQSLEVSSPADLEPVFETAKRESVEAVIVPAGPFFLTHAARTVALAAEYRLPATYGNRELVDIGGLLTYSPSNPSLQRRSAYFVDRILKGTKPADLPVEQPTEFELVINLKTAQALGLTIPQHVLLQATEVIQ